MLTAFAAASPQALPVRRRHRALCSATASSSSHDELPPLEPPEQTIPTKRFRARVAYDGTAYRGWQLQAHGPTVQGALERVLSRRFGRQIRVVGASRTDSGVHARGQAIHFDAPVHSSLDNSTSKNSNNNNDNSDVQNLQFVLNRMLPSDVRVSHLQLAPATSPNDPLQRPWNVLYAATGKLYTYRVCTHAAMDPQLRLYCYREWRAERGPFSARRLRQAVALFEGTHDFSAFANNARTPEGVTAPAKINPIRTVRSAHVRELESGLFAVEFDINGAFYRMIRNIMGTVLDVACFKLELSDVQRLFESRDRRRVPKAAPAHGLCLEEVFFDGWEL